MTVSKEEGQVKRRTSKRIDRENQHMRETIKMQDTEIEALKDERKRIQKALRFLMEIAADDNGDEWI
jgi:predicted RNase H-like nuclease (RuvC/YqgF family)